MVELTAVMPAANDGGYPARFIAGIINDPTVAVSATDNALTECDQSIGYGRARHQFTGEHKKRNRRQRH